MNKNEKPRKGAPSRANLRCAIYTRKSTEEGLDQEFNTLDAQRESGEAFIKSQAHEGWTCLADRYDDGGFTGGNMDRPALRRRLMADIDAGKVDCIVVYKVDRLSRSLLDFAKMMETFDKHHVSFVSVTQQFNTASSMGRLVLNVLLSFAQFEREIISERTRDKIAAARRKGKWAGGHPLLGYDIDPHGFKLIVNENEAHQVQAIFQLYLEHQALLPVVQELERRDWLTKRWTTRKGLVRGGKGFIKTSLHKLLTNVAYAGKIRYRDEIHNGEHAAIVQEDIWKRVQVLLQRNGRTGGSLMRNRFGAILKGLIRCVACDCSMTPSHTTKAGNKRYRYYVCTGAQKRGWATCPTKSIAAGQIEQLVVDQIKCIGNDPALFGETIAEAQLQHAARIADHEDERRRLAREMSQWNVEVRKVAEAGLAEIDSAAVARLADLQERIRRGEQRETEIREEIRVHQRELINDDEIAKAFDDFDTLWSSLTSHEQGRILQMLIEQIDYDGAKGKVSITFRPAGIKALGQELAERNLEATT